MSLKEKFDARKEEIKARHHLRRSKSCTRQLRICASQVSPIGPLRLVTADPVLN